MPPAALARVPKRAASRSRTKVPSGLLGLNQRSIVARSGRHARTMLWQVIARRRRKISHKKPVTPLDARAGNLAAGPANRPDFNIGWDNSVATIHFGNILKSTQQIIVAVVDDNRGIRTAMK